MSFALLLAPASPAASEQVVIDLLVRQPCERNDEAILAAEIVVCAERERQSYHGQAPARGNASRSLPKAEVQLAEGAALAVEAESADLGMARSQRAMVRLKFKF